MNRVKKRSISLLANASLCCYAVACGAQYQGPSSISDDLTVASAQSYGLRTFVETTSHPFTPPTDCRAHIAEVICLVAAEHSGESVDRPCLAGGREYAHYFQELHDHFPSALQRMFCSMRHIYIEQELWGTAYGGVVRDNNEKVIGSAIGIRKSALDKGVDLARWASWKDQLNFGGDANSPDFAFRTDLPVAKTPVLPSVNTFLYFVVSHEMGHIFDFANQLNKTQNCRQKNGRPGEICDFDAGSFGAISWRNTEEVRPGEDFALRGQLCFYGCDRKSLPLDQLVPMYEGLSQRGFISLYGSSGYMDDFADSLAYYLLRRELAVPYQIDTKRGFVYDAMAKVGSAVFKAKRDFIEAFLAKPDIIYPGPQYHQYYRRHDMRKYPLDHAVP